MSIRRRRQKSKKTTSRNLTSPMRLDSNTNLSVERLEDRRMLAAGDLDLTFSTDGFVTDDFGIIPGGFSALEDVQASAIQADGKIVVAGTQRDPARTMIARYNVDGTRDTSFATGGFLVTDISGEGRGNNFSDLVIDPSGNIIIAGVLNRTNTSQNDELAVARFTSSGVLDTTFDGDGLARVEVAFPSTNTALLSGGSIELQTDGKIVVGFTAFESQFTTQHDFAVTRFNSDGSQDTSFGNGGVVINDFAGDRDFLSDIAVQADGKILAYGRITPVGASNDVGLIRYNADGTLDTSFDGDGILTVDVLTTAEVPGLVFSQEFAGSLAIQADGKIVASGSVTEGFSGFNRTHDMFLARFNSDGSADTTFDDPTANPSVPGTVRINFGAIGAFSLEAGEAVTLEPTPDGKILIAGTVSDNFTNAPPSRFGLARVLSDGTLDTTFGTGGTVQATFPNTSVARVRSVGYDPDGRIVAAGLVSTVGGDQDIGIARFQGIVFPTADAGGPYSVNEPGASILLDGTGSSDPANQTLTFEWDLDGDGLFGETGAAAGRGDEIGATPTITIAATDGPASIPVTLRVTNEDTLSDTQTVNIDVLNVDPTIAVDNAAVVINEDQTATNSGTFSDPIDAVALTASIGAVVDNNDGTWSWSYDGVDDLATTTVTITADDGDATSVATFDLTVNNVDPTITADNGAVAIDEGQTATNSGTYADVPADVVTLTTASIGTVTDNNDGTWSWSYDGLDDLATTTVTITATDDDGGSSDVTFNVTVANVDPTIAADSAAVAIDEGQTANNSGTFSDVPADVVTLTASLGTVTDNNDGTWSWSFDGDDDLADTVTITATDDDGGSTDVTFTVTVNNVDPELSNVTTDSAAIGGAVEGDTVTLTADFSDDGLLDTHTATIDWGDGTTSTGVVDQLNGTITADHVYANGGVYDVTLTLVDDDLGSDVATTGAVIAGVGENNGVLQIVGTDGNDIFKVYRSYYSGDYKVWFRLDGGAWMWSTIDFGSVDEIQMQLGDGHDIGFVSRNVYIDATIDSGAGDDLLIGGSGDDVLLAGAGYDTLFGGRGRDLMIGGTGSDLIFGESGSDILISGTTAFDSDADSLDLIMDEWTSDRSYNDRVDNLRGVVGDTFDDRENGEVFLIAAGASATVFDDESIDWLIGGRGRDLYFAGDDDFSWASFHEVIEELEIDI